MLRPSARGAAVNEPPSVGEAALMADSDRPSGPVRRCLKRACAARRRPRSGQLVGRDAAHALTRGERADEASRVRLVSRVVPHDGHATSTQSGGRDRRNPRWPATVEQGRRRASTRLGGLGRWVSANLAELFRTESREGVARVLEKRDPALRRR